MYRMIAFSLAILMTAGIGAARSQDYDLRPSRLPRSILTGTALYPIIA
jgi:hypothetical protein